MNLENEILQLCFDVLEKEMTPLEATKRILLLLDVVGQSEQLKCQCTKTEKYYDPVGDIERCQKCEKAL